MNHHTDDSFYHQVTSASLQAAYGQKNPEQNDSGAEDPLSAVVQADQMNAFIDSYFGEMASSSNSRQSTSKSQQNLMAALQKSRADEDLETLLKETDDMQDIQNQIQLEQIEMAEKYREERSKQRRAAAARSRYQRMSENERRIYNQRRRLRQLGVDPENSVADLDAVKSQVKVANAKKAEAARLRYHRMTAEQKRDYNQRRTEAFRRRRMEEEMLLSTPAGRISAEALAKAQQIMVRNARKAESARLRYQKMSVEERKSYNMKRAAAKKTRKEKVEEIVELQGEDEYFEDGDGERGKDESHVDVVEEELQDISASDLQLDDEVIEQDDSRCEEHMENVINEVANRPPSELGIFARMESEVIRRTRIANETIMRQNNPPNIIQYDLTIPAPEDLVNGEIILSIHEEIIDPSEVGGENSNLSNHQVIDEKMLHEMVRTGMDVNGMPVEIRTVDGTRITSVEDLLNVTHGQTVLITQNHDPPEPSQPTSSQQIPLSLSQVLAASQISQVSRLESKPTNFLLDVPTTSTSSAPSTSTSNSNIQNPPPAPPSQIDINFDDDVSDESLDLNATNNSNSNSTSTNDNSKKINVTRARRAERARARYHRMSQDQRREQNARRATLLRQSRARDEQLCQLAERMPAEQIDEATRNAIEDAKRRRAKRAEQARLKYQKMTEEQRRKYNAARDAQRKSRKEKESSQQSASQLDPDDPSSFFYDVSI